MTQTGDVKTDNATYKMIQGYILVKPLADQFKALHPDAKLRRICDWNRKQSSVCNLHTETPKSITIEGSKEIQGTYFRPDIVLAVLEWVCPAFKEEVRSAYENYVVEQNAVIQATANNGGETDLRERNVRFLQ